MADNKRLNDLTSAAPLADGDVTIIGQGTNAFKAALSALKTFINPVPFTASEQTKLSGIETAATADQTNAEVEIAYNAQVGIVSQGDAEAGSATVAERWTPQRVLQAVNAVGVIATGSTTARSLATRFSEVFHVKDFGAVGDGVADDTTAIQAAIDAAEANGGGTVYLPKGIYDLTTTLTCTESNVHLVGDGQGALDPAAAHDEVPATLLNYRAASSALPILLVESTSAGNLLAPFQISGIALEGNEKATIGVHLIDVQHFHFSNILVRAVTADGILLDQTAGTAAQAAGFGLFDDVSVFLRGHTGSLNANGIRLNGDGSTTPVGVTVVQFNRCRVSHQDGHGYVLDGDFCDAHTFLSCLAFRITTDDGAGINITGTQTDGIRSGIRLLGACAFDGGIQVAAPSGITTNFLPTEGLDLSGILPFEVDTSVADLRMGAIGTGRHLTRGRAYGFRAGLDRCFFGLEPVESSMMRFMFNDLANNRIHMADYIFGAARVGTGSPMRSDIAGGGTQLTTGASTSDTIGIFNADSMGAGLNGYELDQRPAVIWQVKGIDTTNIDIMVGMGETNSISPNNGVYFQINTAVSNNWKCVSRAASTETSVDSTVALSTGVITFMIVTDPTGVTFFYKPASALRQSWRFITHITTNLPTSKRLYSYVKIRTKTTTAKNLHVLNYEHSEYLPDA